MEKYINQIDTRSCGDYTIVTDNYFYEYSPIKRSIDMRITCDSIFKGQHKQMRKILIHLCKYFTVR